MKAVYFILSSLFAASISFAEAEFVEEILVQPIASSTTTEITIQGLPAKKLYLQLLVEGVTKHGKNITCKRRPGYDDDHTDIYSCHLLMETTGEISGKTNLSE